MEQQTRPASTELGAAASADAACVRRTLAGDLTAFDELVGRYQRRVVSVSYRLLGDPQDVADACQEAFLRAFRSLSRLAEPERFGPWLLRITANVSLNFRRGRRSDISLSGEDEGAAASEDRSDSRDLVTVTHDPALSQEARLAIEAALARLPEKQRLCLILFALEGLPHKEVAEILECGVEAVKWNVFQARKRLKEELAEYLTE